MDIAHFNVNKPVFCCPSGALAAQPGRHKPFKEFEKLLSQMSQPSPSCTCRSLFTRCELHDSSSGIGAVFRKFARLPGRRSSKCKLNGKPVITVMHDTLVKNNEPLVMSNNNESNQHPPPSVPLSEKQVKSESCHWLSIAGSGQSRSDCSFHTNHSIPSSSSSFAFTSNTAEHYHSLPVDADLLPPLDQPRSRSQNDFNISPRNRASICCAEAHLTASTFPSIQEHRTSRPYSTIESPLGLSSINIMPVTPSDRVDSFNSSVSPASSEMRLPSYVGISCAISGYRGYARNGRNERTSPLRKPLVLGTSSLVNREPVTLRKQDILRTKPCFTTCSTEQQENTPVLLEFSSLDSEDDHKSLVQKRIESLYGQQFASNWRESRAKQKQDKLDSSSFRSPSCPPEIIANFACKKNLPVFRHITNTYLSQQSDLQVNSSTENYRTSMSNATVNGNQANLQSIPQMTSVDVVDGGALCSERNSARTPSPVPSLIEIEPVEYREPEQLLAPRLVNEKNVLPNQDNEQKEEKSLSQDKINSKEEVKDGHWYLKLLDLEVAKIMDRITVFESIELSENLDNFEEVAGKLRCAIGKANLLINQKLQQFRELCNKNISENENEQFRTRNEDLQGFWEMVNMQVDDVHKTFDDLLLLQKNDWKPIIKSTQLRKKVVTSSKTSATRKSVTKPKDLAKEEARRAQLREAKRKQMQANQSNKNDTEQIVIFASSATSAKDANSTLE